MIVMYAGTVPGASLSVLYLQNPKVKCVGNYRPQVSNQAAISATVIASTWVKEGFAP